MAIIYKAYPDGLSVASQCVIPKERIVGMFLLRMRKIKILMEKLNDQGKVIDVSGRDSAKTFILLDTGWGIVSGFTVRTLSNNMMEVNNERNSKDSKEDCDEAIIGDS